MTISYKWLNEYLPLEVTPERLSRILTSIGLEVESMENYESIKGGLNGLIIGEVLSAEKHPNADKLTLTTVNIGNAEPLQIVCGAPNVAVGQRVVVAPVGATIYPTTGDSLTMRIAKIRGEESHGMICAEDEIGMGNSHAGIMVLPETATIGVPATDFFKPYQDVIYEIGLTPNRMDAMSHWGVARDVCAYLSHHDKKELKPKIPNSNSFKIDNKSFPIAVTVENEKACPRYSGLTISNILISTSPQWLQDKLKAIGLRPINNIVDITNFIQHETGQPLHAFDADKLADKKIVVKNLSEGTAFITLDEKERKLSADDLMICDADGAACIAGVYGGLHSGVTETTTNLFLESAFFEPVAIRKTSFRHGLRTDAASRFEKGTDISATVNVLKRAALLIKELAGGEISSDIVDIYPTPALKTELSIKWHFIKKLSGKNYHPDAIMNILTSLGFEIINEGIDALRVAVPFHKPDISLPADLVEEIIRIDGLDNIEIPTHITMSPALEENAEKEIQREKIANFLAGNGFMEMMTNSITNAAYFTEEEQATMVKMTNSLSANLNILRNSLFETSLEVIAHNHNHKNLSLRLFEFGKSYQVNRSGKYAEQEQLCLAVTGDIISDHWKRKAIEADVFYLKGMVLRLLSLLGLGKIQEEELEMPKLRQHLVFKIDGEIIAGVGMVAKNSMEQFGIKQPVYFANLYWEKLMVIAAGFKKEVEGLPRFPAVQRDIAMIVDKHTAWKQVEQSVRKIKLPNLRGLRLFDIFESEKLGDAKKSLAVNFTFLDEEKTLTDQEIDGWMNKIRVTLEKDIQAEIRK